MSADFWAGYISGAAGILVGNPLDVIKVRLQAGSGSETSNAISQNRTEQAVPTAQVRRHESRIRILSPSTYIQQFESTAALIRGATAPILGYGALNALLFVTYNRTAALLEPHHPEGTSSREFGLWTTWVAGAVGGLATWVISTPTEVVKCRSQLQMATLPGIIPPTSQPRGPITSSFPLENQGLKPASSFRIARSIFLTEGIKGFYIGGVITALRDSIGYGFYFWSYELCTRWVSQQQYETPNTSATSNPGEEAAKVLICGGIAGVVTWASVFPLDVIKTRVQTQDGFQNTNVREPLGPSHVTPLLQRGCSEPVERIGAREMARQVHQREGFGAFWRGLGVCSIRAFIVNAAQWAVYEWIMRELDPCRGRQACPSKDEDAVLI